MPTHKSALKRLKQTRKRTQIQRVHHTRLRHQLRHLRRALQTKDKAAATALLRPTISIIDKSIRKGVLHRNAAARTKSRLMQRLHALG